MRATHVVIFFVSWQQISSARYVQHGNPSVMTHLQSASPFKKVRLILVNHYTVLLLDFCRQTLTHTMQIYIAASWVSLLVQLIYSRSRTEVCSYLVVPRVTLNFANIMEQSLAQSVILYINIRF